MSDIEIARNATLKPISEIADSLNIPNKVVMPLGYDKAKLNLNGWMTTKISKLILVTAINPTPAGEGKTTTLWFRRWFKPNWKKAIICLREPLGPCFARKGAAGGGYSKLCQWRMV